MSSEYGIAASAIVLGTAVAFELRPSPIIAALLVACFAILHDHAHGTEFPPGQSALLDSMGFVIATGCLHALGIGIGTVYHRPLGRTLLRGAGTSTAADPGHGRWQGHPEVQNASCEQRWQEIGAPKSPEEQCVIGLPQSDPH